jgi:hypothetical protein
LHLTPSEPPKLNDRAADQLRFIRDTMERASAFTIVSGRGMMASGVVGTVAAALSVWRPRADDPAAWVLTWIAAALVASACSFAGIRAKARATDQSLISGVSRRFLLAFAPGIIAGAILTGALLAAGESAMLAGTWLTLYGTAVTAGGAHSVRPVPVLGACFLVLGAATFAAPAAWETALLALGFGALHLVFGYLLTRDYGG